MRAQIEFINVNVDVEYNYYRDPDTDGIEIEVTGVYVGNTDIWEILEAGRLIESVETEVYEQIYCN